MAASKELLTDILDGITVVHTFLQQGLSQASLPQSCQLQRQDASKTIEDMIDKIRHAHPSIRPRVNTPGGLKKPPHLPPAPSKGPAPPLPEEQEELYEEPAADPMPTQQVDTHYLSFEPTHPKNIDEGEEPQEMYEAMAVMEDQDLYEEPVTQENADAAENYEDPVHSQPSSTSLTQYSQENSEAEYAETMPQHTAPGLEPSIEMSMDWSNVYTTPPKGEKLKASTIKNISIKGYLDKLGGRNHKTWQRRYCVLAGPLMYFYEKESSKNYNNCIALLSFTESEAPNMTNEKKYQFGFKLTHLDSNTGKKKDYYFRTTSQDVRNKWLSCIANLSKTVLSSAPNAFSTMPRGMPSHTVASSVPPRKRTHSEGEGEGELYEDMAIPEEAEDQGEYVAVSPAENHGNIELESSEEYVDVVPQHDIEQEEYEDTSAFQQPPPPLSPPPGPPSEVFTPALSLPPKAPGHAEAPKAPAPPPPVEVDTSRVYTQPSDISLEKVFVTLWDFAASASDELALHRGDLVYVSSPLTSEEWWYGEALDPEASKRLGAAGFFPQRYSTVAFEPTA